ncbi:MAG: ABC transporter substrate-binding protein [Pseudomonadota bacterium]
MSPKQIFVALMLGAVLHAGTAVARPLVLAVSRGPVSATVYVAEANGYFAREGVEVQTRDCSSGRSCFFSLVDGTADVATAAEVVVTLNRLALPDVAIIGTISTSSHQIKLIARRSAKITEPTQMRGKRVATVAGTSAQYFLDTWLLFHDIDPGQLSRIQLAPDQLSGALQRREVDAIAIWEPLASNTLKALAEDGLILPNPRVYTQHFALMTTRRVIGAPHGEDDLVKLLRALLRAQRFISDEPVAVKQILMRRLEIDDATAQAQLAEHDFRVRLDQSLVSTMGNQARWAVREGHLKPQAKQVSPLLLIEPDLLRVAAPAAVTLVH